MFVWWVLKGKKSEHNPVAESLVCVWDEGGSMEKSPSLKKKEQKKNLNMCKILYHLWNMYKRAMYFWNNK